MYLFLIISIIEEERNKRDSSVLWHFKCNFADMSWLQYFVSEELKKQSKIIGFSFSTTHVIVYSSCSMKIEYSLCLVWAEKFRFTLESFVIRHSRFQIPNTNNAYCMHVLFMFNYLLLAEYNSISFQVLSIHNFCSVSIIVRVAICHLPFEQIRITVH